MTVPEVGGTAPPTSMAADRSPLIGLGALACFPHRFGELTA